MAPLACNRGVPATGGLGGSGPPRVRGSPMNLVKGTAVLILGLGHVHDGGVVDSTLPRSRRAAPAQLSPSLVLEGGLRLLQSIRRDIRLLAIVSSVAVIETEEFRSRFAQLEHEPQAAPRRSLLFGWWLVRMSRAATEGRLEEEPSGGADTHNHPPASGVLRNNGGRDGRPGVLRAVAFAAWGIAKNSRFDYSGSPFRQGLPGRREAGRGAAVGSGPAPSPASSGGLRLVTRRSRHASEPCPFSQEMRWSAFA